MRDRNPPKRNIKLWIAGSIILLLIIFLLGPFYIFLKKDLKISPIRTLLFSGGLRKVNNQVNVLILGIPGGNHDGPLLSDSMIVLNYDFSKKRAVTIGIPRDVWSPTLQDKLNSAYAYGEAKKPGGGLTLAKAEVGSVVGIPIQYVIVMNFNEFKDVVDYFGGVNIDVKTAFVDKKFPIEGKENDECNGDEEFGCRYQTVKFGKGLQHMNGDTALKFVRSRNAIGKEGSDFARSLRQQLIIDAVKQKVLKKTLSFNIDEMRRMYTELDKSVQRDIDNQQAASLAKNFVLNSKFYQKNFGISRGLFETPQVDQYEGKYVLVPKKDWNTVHDYVKCLLDKEDEKQCSYLEKD